MAGFFVLCTIAFFFVMYFVVALMIPPMWYFICYAVSTICLPIRYLIWKSRLDQIIFQEKQRKEYMQELILQGVDINGYTIDDILKRLDRHMQSDKFKSTRNSIKKYKKQIAESKYQIIKPLKCRDLGGFTLFDLKIQLEYEWRKEEIDCRNRAHLCVLEELLWDYTYENKWGFYEMPFLSDTGYGMDTSFITQDNGKRIMAPFDKKIYHIARIPYNAKNTLGYEAHIKNNWGIVCSSNLLNQIKGKGEIDYEAIIKEEYKDKIDNLYRNIRARINNIIPVCFVSKGVAIRAIKNIAIPYTEIFTDFNNYLWQNKELY